MHPLSNIILALGALWYCLSAGQAYAQSLLPSAADPSRFEDYFQKKFSTQELDGKPLPEFTPGSAIPQAVGGFTLSGVTLSGVTAFEDAVLDPIISKYVGRKANLEVLNHLTGRLTQFYRSKGYFLAYAIVKPQEVEGGIIEISVIEGGVNSVVFDDPDNLLADDLFGISGKIRDKIQNLTPLHGPALERYMLLLNKGGGIVVRSIISNVPNPNAPGIVDITLKVEARDDRIVIDYNNHGSRFVGPHQVNTSYNTGRVFAANDSLTLQGVVSIPFEEVQFGSWAYELPLNENGLRLHAVASYSNSEPGASLRDLEVESDSKSFELGLTYPLITSRRTNLSIGTNLRVSHTSIEFLDEELIDDKLRIISVNANFNTLDPWDGSNNIYAEISQGLDILSATKTGSANLSRTQGRSDFSKIESSFSRAQQLNNYLSVSTILSGQYAPHPLLSAEEFGYGGADIGRAYSPAEITGDSGLAAAIEVAYTALPITADILSLVPFAFYDVGKVWNHDVGTAPLSAASAGMGVYYGLEDMASGSIQLAWPLTKTIATPVTGSENGPRILFSVKTVF